MHVEREPTERGLAAFARCVLRHGGLEQVELMPERRHGRDLARARERRPDCPRRRPEDLGAAAANRLVESLGGSLTVEVDRLLVRLPVSD